MDDKITVSESFQEDYANYVVECRCALNLVVATIENTRELLVRSGGFYGKQTFTIKSRIKTAESAYEKCTRRGWDPTIQTVRDRLHDVAGVRIVTLFPDDIEKIAAALASESGMPVVMRKDYLANPKDNGYSSLHLVVQREVRVNGQPRLIPVEVQIRCMAMDLWSAMEHLLNYKDEPSAEDIAQFKAMAEAMDKFNEIATSIREKRIARDTLEAIGEMTANESNPFDKRFVKLDEIVSRKPDMVDTDIVNNATDVESRREGLTDATDTEA